MKFTPKDFEDAKKVIGLFANIDALTLTQINTVSDAMYKVQPFSVIHFMRFQPDMDAESFGKFIKVHFVIWEYFKDNKNIEKEKLTEKYFDGIYDQNIAMLTQATGKVSKKQDHIYDKDLQNLKSKGLLSIIMQRFSSQPSLSALDAEVTGIALLSLKSLIECLETIAAGAKPHA